MTGVTAISGFSEDARPLSFPLYKDGMLKGLYF